MKKRITGSFVAAAISVCCVLGSAMSASAITADDVAQRARQAGWPEYLIQIGYNQWSSGDYTEADLQQAYNSVSTYDSQVEEMICNMFGVDKPQTPAQPTTPPAPQQPATPAPTTPSTVSPTKPAETTPATPNSGTVSTDAPAGGGTTGNNTTTGGDGQGETPAPGNTVSSADFISMTLEEKIAYVNSMSPEQKSAFIANLTPEERNSILRQMPLENQAGLMEQYIQIAEQMGVSVVVDSLTEDNISVVVRDGDGVVIDNAAVGVTIDETGVSHTMPLLFAGGGVLLAAAGFIGLYVIGRRED